MASSTAMMPNGILIRKIQRQEVSVTTAPPNIGPIMRPITGGTVNQTMADTICAGATERSRISRPTGTIIAPPRPCKTRNSTSSGSEVAAPHSAEPSENNTIARQNTRLVPKRSASQWFSRTSPARAAWWVQPP